MTPSKPHFLLFSDAQRARSSCIGAAGRWSFVLESVQSQEKVAACDTEPAAAGERLELLAVVRGLEALDQPSKITLVTPSRYVSRGLRFGLEEWRDNDWRWDRYGKKVPVKNGDLWRRVDRALRYHTMECRFWRVDRPHDEVQQPSSTVATEHHSADWPTSRSVADVAPPGVLGRHTVVATLLRFSGRVLSYVTRRGRHHTGSALRWQPSTLPAYR